MKRRTFLKLLGVAPVAACIPLAKTAHARGHHSSVTKPVHETYAPEFVIRREDIEIIERYPTDYLLRCRKFIPRFGEALTMTLVLRPREMFLLCDDHIDKYIIPRFTDAMNWKIEERIANERSKS